MLVFEGATFEKSNGFSVKVEFSEQPHAIARVKIKKHLKKDVFI